MNHHEHAYQEHDHMAYGANGEMVKTEEFPFDLVDRRLAGKVEPAELLPANHFRQAALKFFPFLDQILVFIMQHENPRFAAWVAAVAVGRISLTDGATQLDIAEKFGATKAAVSKATKILQTRLGNSIAGIPTMPGQREKEACQRMAQARNEQINHHHKNENSK